MEIIMGPYNIVKSGEYDIVINVGKKEDLDNALKEYKERLNKINVYKKTTIDNNINYDVIGYIESYNIIEENGINVVCDLKFINDYKTLENINLSLEFIGTSNFIDENKTIQKNVNKISAIIVN